MNPKRSLDGNMGTPTHLTPFSTIIAPIKHSGLQILAEPCGNSAVLDSTLYGNMGATNSPDTLHCNTIASRTQSRHSGPWKFHSPSTLGIRVRWALADRQVERNEDSDPSRKKDKNFNFFFLFCTPVGKDRTLVSNFFITEIRMICKY